MKTPNAKTSLIISLALLLCSFLVEVHSFNYSMENETSLLSSVSEEELSET